MTLYFVRDIVLCVVQEYCSRVGAPHRSTTLTQSSKCHSQIGYGGSTNLELQMMKDHVKASRSGCAQTQHELAMEWRGAKSGSGVAVAQRRDLYTTIAAQQKGEWAMRFALIVWLATHAIANQHFASLIDLITTGIRLLGISWTSAFHADNAQYTSSTFYREAIFATSDYLRESVLRSIGDSTFTILIDETTDSANRNQLIIYIRWFDRKHMVDGKQGNLREEFLGMVALKQGDADTIFTALLDFVRGEGLDFARWVGFCSDGASVMVGIHTGVATRLKDEVNAYMVCVHCANHRFALACADSAKEVDYLRLVYQPALISLWSFLSFSTSRWSNLQAHYAKFKKYVLKPCACFWSVVRVLTRVSGDWFHYCEFFGAVLSMIPKKLVRCS